MLQAKTAIGEKILEPHYSKEEDLHALRPQKERQRFYYDRHTKPLKPIAEGETVRMRLPGEPTWSAGTCTGQVGTQSYEVEVNGRHYRRNCRHLIQTSETKLSDPPDDTPSAEDRTNQEPV